MKRAKFKNVLCIFIAVVLLTACDPFKVTDPNDPNFDPMQFKFEDYLDTNKLAEVLSLMFPIQSDKFYVEQILVSKAGARIVNDPADHQSMNKIHYIYQPHDHNSFLLYLRYIGDGWNITPVYEDEKLKQIFINGGCISMRDKSKRILGCQTKNQFHATERAE